MLYMEELCIDKNKRVEYKTTSGGPHSKLKNNPSDLYTWHTKEALNRVVQNKKP